MKKVKKKMNWKKILSIVVVVTLIQPIFSKMGVLNALAENIVEDSGVTMENQLDLKDVPTFVTSEHIEEYGHTMRLYEKETELNTVVFQNSNGTQTVYYMGYPLRYIDENGELKDIDLTLKDNGTVYKTTANDVEVSISKQYDSGITLSYGGISLGLVAIPPIDSGTSGSISTTVMVTTQMTENDVVYKNIFGEGIDVKYTPLYTGVKEDIIISKYTGNCEFQFLLTTNGLMVYENEEGGYYIAENEGSVNRVEIGEVLAYDAESDICEGELTIVPIKSANLYQITVSVDTSFLVDSDTVYPVTIDPTLTVSDETHGTDSIQDTPVYSELETRNFGSNKYNFVGYTDSTYGVGRTVVRLQGLLDDPIYATLSGASVTSAKFYVKDSSGQSNKTIHIHALTSNSTWTESSVTWQTMGTMSSTVQASASLGKASWSSFDITYLVRNWLNAVYNEDCGFVMKGADETLKSNFHSSECSTVENRPYFTITYEYREASGVVSGQTYFIKNVYSGHYLQADTSMNNEVIQNVFHGDSYQQWKIVYQGNGLYKLYNQYAGYISEKYCLDLKELNGDEIDLFKDLGGSYVKFYIIANGDGSYRLLNCWPGGDDVLTVLDGYALSKVYNRSWEKDLNQKWQLELATTKLANTKTFSIFDVGESTEDEAALVKRYLEYDGYTSVGIYDNSNYYVPAQAIKDIGRYSDVVYLNGHGGFYANLWVMDSNKITCEYLCAEDSVDTEDSVPKVGIGAQWKDGSTTKTTSYWNQKTKWAILAQCDQLNFYDRGDVEYETGMQPAELWAKTLLGDGNRMHGILGYYNGAPGGSTHYNRLENFLIHTSKDNNMTLIEAWKMVNSPLIASSNWATIYHSANVSDKFSSFTSTTANGSEYTIYLARNEQFTGELGLQSQTNVIETEAVYGNVIERPVLCNDMVEIKITQTYEKLCSTLGLNDNDRLQMDDVGRISYFKSNVDWGEKDMEYNLSNEQAIELAEKMLLELELLPENGYRACVSRVERLKFDTENSCFGNPEIIEYAVCFYQTYNGKDVLSDQQDGIVIRFNKDGITSFDYLWREMKIASVNQDEKTDMLSQEQVQKIYMETSGDSKLETSLEITSAYLQIDGQTHLVWAFADSNNYRNSVFIDAYTGEELSFE